MNNSDNLLVRCLSFDKEKCENAGCYWSSSYIGIGDGIYHHYPQSLWDSPSTDGDGYGKIDENKNKICCNTFCKPVIIKKYSTLFEYYMENAIRKSEEK